MHSVIKHLNRKQVHYCRNCVVSAIKKVKDEVDNECYGAKHLCGQRDMTSMHCESEGDETGRVDGV